MNQTAPDPQGEHAPLLEVRLHALSPLSPVVNGFLIVVLLYGAYLAIAISYGQTLVISSGGEVRINPGAWAAFVLSLVFAMAVTVPALTSRGWAASLPDLEATLDEDGRKLARNLAIGPARDRVTRALIAFAIGAVGGIAFNIWLMRDSGMTLVQFAQSTGLWFLIVQPVLFGLGVRAALQLGDDDKDMARLVLGHVEVHLARLEALQVYGRLATRSALSWLVMAAVILLFFVYAAPVAVSIGSLVLALLAGGYAFVTTIRPVVKVAGEARDVALVSVRTKIAECGGHTLEGREVETPLSELVAYEAWLEKRPVWPISAPITRRLALYGLIPILAWFGAAAAELLLESLAG